MNQAIGDILPMAVGVAISPIPVIAVILMLFTPRARTNSLAFLAGWVVGLTVAGTVFLIVGGSATDDGSDSTSSGWIKMAIGAALLVLAIRNWRSRPRGDDEPDVPKWMSAIDEFNAVKSFGLAFVLSAVNPKNLALTAAAAIAISGAGLTTGEEFMVLALFILIASVTVAIPTLGYLAAGERLDDTLTSAKDWLLQNNHVVMAVLLLVIGAKLIGDGMGSL